MNSILPPPRRTRAESFQLAGNIPPRTSSSGIAAGLSHYAPFAPLPQRALSNGSSSGGGATHPVVGRHVPADHGSQPLTFDDAVGRTRTSSAAAGPARDHGSPTLRRSRSRPMSEGSWMASPKRVGSLSLSHGSQPQTPTAMANGDVVRATNDRATNNDDDEAARAELHSPRSGLEAGWKNEQERILLGPYDYLHHRPGKNIRKQLVKAFNAWLKVPAERLEIIHQVVGMLHTASLLIDDIEDSSLLRRGIPAAHHIFGTPQTLNSANYVYFCALQELLKLGNPRFVAVYGEELCDLHRGQGLDLYWRDSLICPTEAEYLHMVGNKTGGLFRLAIKLMQAESASDKDFVPLVNQMGIIFQIRDDYLNLWSPAYSTNKGLCEDLTEGKFSFPIIHSIRVAAARGDGDQQLLHILRQRPTDEAVKRYAVTCMEGTGSFDYCRAAVRQRVQHALDLVAALERDVGPNPEVRAILDKFRIEAEA